MHTPDSPIHLLVIKSILYFLQEQKGGQSQSTKMYTTCPINIINMINSVFNGSQVSILIVLGQLQYEFIVYHSRSIADDGGDSGMRECGD